MVKKKTVKTIKKSKKEKRIAFEVEGDNDDLGGDISVDLDEESKMKGAGRIENDEESDEEGKVDLDGEIKYLKVKASKPVEQLKKGDKVKVDGLTLEVDSQYV